MHAARGSPDPIVHRPVTTADIEALTELVDRVGSKVVCNLLVAYGYAREPFERSEENGAAPEPGEDLAEADAEESEEEGE